MKKELQAEIDGIERELKAYLEGYKAAITAHLAELEKDHEPAKPQV